GGALRSTRGERAGRRPDLRAGSAGRERARSQDAGGASGRVRADCPARPGNRAAGRGERRSHPGGCAPLARAGSVDAARGRGALFRAGSASRDAGAGAGMKIKLCGVRTVADALLCTNEGADEIGVIFAVTSRRRVTVAEAKAIRDALPAQVPLVGVFLDAALEEVIRIAGEVGLQAAQLHGEWPTGRAPLPLHAAL